MPSLQRYCCVCQNFGGKVIDGTKVSMRRFPADLRLRKVLIQRCSNAFPNFVFVNSDQTRLCGVHFVGRRGPTKGDPLPCFFLQAAWREKVYKLTTLENVPEAIENNSTPETEEMSDNRSPDLSFESDAVGLLVDSSFTLVYQMLQGSNSGRPKSLRLIDEFLMVLIRLRLGLLLDDLADRLHVYVGTCSTFFNRWVDNMDSGFSFLVKWPSRKNINDTMPERFRRKYSKCRVIIDCMEIRTETPCSLQMKSLLYSDYKSNMTWKSLIRISPSGIVTFVSDLYPGSISDKQITKQCGLVNLCEMQ